ncbi:MAG TPA: MoaD/ThiS family protein [Methanothrix sp.]|nr:MoaD/ThiS family protein [Methanothrix sp.]HPJ83228.1 MoaD/ThiS family protein [Methanothrix sp.]HPR66782.1 MoaD/ThiS family protein [Methanothrix sp.]
MKIRLKAFARYRDLLGGEMEVDLPEGSTIIDLLNKLASRSNDLRDQIFDASGKIRDDVNVMVNGRHFESLEGSETVLADGDEVALFPAVVGG